MTAAQTQAGLDERVRGVANQPVRLEIVGETNVGMKRTHNEDNFAVLTDENLVIVADGMGGHASGEVASKMAVDSIREFFEATAKDPDATWPYKMDKQRSYEENRLMTSIKLANLRIFESAQREPRFRGMGTTIVTVAGVREGVIVGHVGDSRVYRIRGKQIDQLTEDHSLLNDYLKMRKLTEEEIANFPHKNVIVRALGMKDVVKVDATLQQPVVGDIFLLCSDGLSGPVPDPDILRLVDENRDDLKLAASKLIARANDNGGPDNITCCLVRWLGAAN